MVTLASLNVSAPTSATPPNYATWIKQGDGQSRGMGDLRTSWRWDFISLTEKAALDAYTGATIFIKTPDEDEVFTVYECIPHRRVRPPAKGEENILDYIIEFTELVEP